MATSEPWVRNWRVQWKGPWRVLDECSYAGLQHNTETAALGGCICPRALAVKPIALAKRRVHGTRSFRKWQIRRDEQRLILLDPIVKGARRPNLSSAACRWPEARALHERALDMPNTGTAVNAAKKVCDRCPIQRECRNWVLGGEKVAGDWGGVYGGLSVRDREKARSAA